MRLLRSAAFAAALALAAAAPAHAEDPVVGMPHVHESARVISFHDKPALLVRSIAVAAEDEVRLHWECGCSRYPTRTVESEPKQGLTRYSGVNWILRKGDRIELFVTHSGMVGRFLVLGVARPLSRHSLTVTASGCVAAGRKKVTCPAAPDREPPATEGPPVNTTYSETVGGETHTWTDYHSAGGSEGAMIHTGETVQVACKVTGYRVPDGDEWWYRIASSPWNGAYYATADAFYNNGQTSGSLEGSALVDPAVRDC